MSITHQELGRLGADRVPDVVDFAFLAAQTFEDAGLARDILGLFVTQARNLVPTLPTLPVRLQGEVAHRLCGSARGIGAFAAAEAAAAYERAEPGERAARFPALSRSFAEAEAAIAAHLAAV